ncbi:MAG: PAS domain S-box protein [Thermoleophilia bacterium]|nr:PAS domain S-box protein [Thermoleophilia bacterium]
MNTPDQRTAELEAILQGLPELYVRVDAAGSVLGVHGAPAREMGARAEIAGKRLDDLLPPDVAGEIHAALREVLRSGRVATVPYGLEVTKGVRCFEARVSRLTEGQAVVSCHDGSERAHAVADLQESEARHRSVVAALHEGVVVQRMDGTVITSNASAARLLGLTEQELSEKGLGGVRSTAIRENGREIPPDQRPGAVTLRTGKAISDAVMGLRRPDGATTWISVNTVPLVRPGDPQPYAVVSSFSDITARREAEQRTRTTTARLSTLIERLNSGVLLEDAQRRVTIVNTALCEMLGIRAQPHALVGGDCGRAAQAAAQLAEDPAAFLARIDEILAANATVTGERVRFADGRVFDRDHTLVTLDGRILGRLWVYRDVTALVSQQAELSRARDEAVDAARERAAFMATLSHEIRTPLGGLADHIDRLSRSSLEASQLELVRVLRTSVDQVLSVIDDALQVSSLDAGGATVQDTPFIPGDVVDAAAALFAPNATRKGIALMHHVEPSLRSPMRGDPVRLRQVVDNLVSNAVKFTDSGMVEVGASLVTGPDDRPVLTVAVTDTGPGMTEETRDRLIAGFSAVDGSEARRQGGTGLGLSIVKSLVDLMGGTIDVTSTAGLGTTVTVTVPLAREDQAATAPAGPAAPDAPMVLLLEGDDAQARLAEQMLGTGGHRTVRTRTAEEALDLVSERPGRFVAVLVDCRASQGFDGYEAARGIRRAEQERRLPRTPIIGLTPNGPAGEREECLIAGMNGCVGIPLQAGELREALSRWGATVQRSRGMVRLAALDRLVEEHRGDLDHVRAVVARYLDTLRRGVATAREASGRGDAAGVAGAARELAALSDALGAQGFATLCRDTARKPHPGSASQLAEQAGQVEMALRGWLSTVGG